MIPHQWKCGKRWAVPRAMILSAATFLCALNVNVQGLLLMPSQLLHMSHLGAKMPLALTTNGVLAVSYTHMPLPTNLIVDVCDVSCT